MAEYLIIFVIIGPAIFLFCRFIGIVGKWIFWDSFRNLTK